MAEESTPATDWRSIPISGLVPMVSVSNVERSAAFYRLLGLAVGNRQPRTGLMHWAWLYAPAAPDWRRGPNLMLVRSESAVSPVPQNTLYLYVSSLVALREELVRAGQTPGPIRHPEYLPRGEFQLFDPDGYKLMIAQNDTDTP